MPAGAPPRRRKAMPRRPPSGAAGPPVESAAGATSPSAARPTASPKNPTRRAAGVEAKEPSRHRGERPAQIRFGGCGRKSTRLIRVAALVGTVRFPSSADADTGSDENSASAAPDPARPGRHRPTISRSRRDGSERRQSDDDAARGVGLSVASDSHPDCRTDLVQGQIGPYASQEEASAAEAQLRQKYTYGDRMALQRRRKPHSRKARRNRPRKGRIDGQSQTAGTKHAPTD